MKSIEEEAREYGNIDKDLIIDTEERYYKNFQKYDGFKAGVEFAQDWIPVNKELPEWYTGCRLDILVKRETFNYPASVKIHTIYFDKDIQELKEMYTHWRLIELK